MSKLYREPEDRLGKGMIAPGGCAKAFDPTPYKCENGCGTPVPFPGENCGLCLPKEFPAPYNARAYQFGMRIGPNASQGGEVLEDYDPSPVDGLLKKWLPQVVNLFRTKARDYDAGDIFTADHLGAAGQYAEIWRKVPKLKKAMWDGEELKTEPVEEVLMDIIGHCLLALDFVGRTK